MSPLFSTGHTAFASLSKAGNALRNHVKTRLAAASNRLATAYGRQKSRLRRYALALFIMSLAAALQWTIYPWVGARIPFLFFLPALVLSATLLGRVPALLTLAVGLVNGFYLLAPSDRWQAIAMADRLSLAAYTGVGLFLVFAGSRLRLRSHRAAEVEQRLQLVQENAGVGLFEIDLVRRTIFGSPTLYQLLGRTPDADRSGKHVPLEQWNAAFRDEEVQKAGSVFRQKAREGASRYETEHYVTLASGHTRCLLSKVHIERDRQGTPVRLRGATVDITERKHIEALLEQTRGELTQQVADLQRLHDLSSWLPELEELPRQLQAVLHTLLEIHGCTQGLICLVDPERDQLAVEAAIGFAPLQPDLTAACGIALTRRQRVVVDDIDTAPGLETLRPLAQAQGWRAMHAMPLVGSQGEVIGVAAVYSGRACRPSMREIRLADLCARKAAVYVERARAHARAQTSDQRFQLALDASAVPFMIFAPVRDAAGKLIDFRWTYCNNAIDRIFEHSKSALIGRRASEVYPGFWEDNGLFAHYAAVAEQGQTREFELQAQQGKAGWFHIIASPLQGAVAVWCADITERKRQEQALQDADRRKDEFLATLAHELRNPLAPIRQAAAISRMPQASPEQKRWSHEVIDRQLQHMALLLDDLLDVSRITRGTLQLRMARTELAQVVEAAIETARPLIDAKEHRLAIELPQQAVTFEADQLRMAQVLANLLMNAAKYTDPGGVLSLQAACQDGQLVIRVSDNGIGIDPATLDEIFRMFTQVRSTRDRTNGGLGIGLALAKGLIELHGGTIVAHSRGLGHGSQFSVCLPLARNTVEQAPAPETSGSATHPGHPRRILIADDNRDAAESLALLLQLDGHEVDIAFDGEAALAEFSRLRPEFVLLDIGMPKLTGTEVAQSIRRLPGGELATLIAITGWGQERDKNQAYAAGFNHHLTKPIDPQGLQHLLAHAPRPLAGSCQ